MANLIKAGVLTTSDRSARGERTDESGLLLKFLLEQSGIEVIAYQVIPDDLYAIRQKLCYMADILNCDFILTTGGTGLGPRDLTPEATHGVLEKEIPGISEAIRVEGLKKTKFAMLSRAVAGVRGTTLIINLPGSPRACEDAFQTLQPVLLHTLELLKGEVKDCQSSISH